MPLCRHAVMPYVHMSSVSYPDLDMKAKHEVENHHTFVEINMKSATHTLLASTLYA